MVLALALVATVAAHGQPETNPCSIGWAQAPRIDPRNFYVNCFPELGRMIGTITHPHFPGDGEEYGASVYAVGDVDWDSIADWIVTHRRADTSVKGVPVELLLYHGRRGGLPPVESGQRIGPSELGTMTTFLTAGDFDRNSYKDIVVSVRQYGDTSFGGGSHDIGLVIVFWGGKNGYSITDTTRLQCGEQMWLGPQGGLSYDFDGDGIEDLMTWSQSGFSNGQVIKLPSIFIFKGSKLSRWGQATGSRLPVWSWWNSPTTRFYTNVLKTLDQDLDGNNDIVFYLNHDAGSAETAQVSILYGKPGGGFPDTSAVNIQTILFDRPDSTLLPGSFSMLSDVSGDSIPELLVFDNDLRALRVYIGLRGQRLLQQYGGGNEPAHPDSTVWWGKPWARIDMPNKINPDSWNHPENLLFDLGDANFDGVNDLWLVSVPFLICYSSGYALDSLIDGMADLRPWDGASFGGIVRLGDIDGSGVPAFSINSDVFPHDYPEAFPGGIKFFKMTDSVPWWNGFGEGRRYPPYTLRSTVADVTTEPRDSRATMLAPLVMEARPNPTTGEIRLSWTMPADGTSSLTISNESGRELELIRLTPGSTSIVWSCAGMPAGVYLATLRIGATSAASKVVKRGA